MTAGHGRLHQTMINECETKSNDGSQAGQSRQLIQLGQTVSKVLIRQTASHPATLNGTIPALVSYIRTKTPLAHDPHFYAVVHGSVRVRRTLPRESDRVTSSLRVGASFPKKIPPDSILWQQKREVTGVFDLLPPPWDRRRLTRGFGDCQVLAAVNGRLLRTMIYICSCPVSW